MLFTLLRTLSSISPPGLRLTPPLLPSLPSKALMLFLDLSKLRLLAFNARLPYRFFKALDDVF